MEKEEELVKNFAVNANKDGMIIFAGAGISVPPPCNCPTWARLKREILGCFLDKLIREDWPKKSYLKQIKPSIIDMELRPETFMWALSGDISMTGTLDMIGGINSSSPNLNHEILAILSKPGIIKAIITTNFDTYIEKSLYTKGIDFKTVRDISEIDDSISNRSGAILLYKPHGCLSKPSSMEYRIDQIQLLPESKRVLLTDLLKSSPVMVIGYSGNDEDIFPVMCEALSESEYDSFICIFPGSPKNEPIQQWDINDLPNVKRFFADPTLILSSIMRPFINTHDGPSSSTFVKDSTDAHSWREHVSNVVKEIGHDVIAMTVAHLCNLHGQHHRALSFANLAQDICEDTDLSSTPRESLMFIKELQARIYKELGQAQLAEDIQSSRLRGALEGDNDQEVLDALLGRADAALRNNNLESAERDLNLAGVHLIKMGRKEPKEASPGYLQYLWYSGILKRKQYKAKEADIFFNQAKVTAHVQNDIVHGSRILLDYGYVKCQLDDWESAQQMWGLSAILAEQVNDWDTAAKATKNRGILLSVSDNPQLGRPEIEKSKLLFQRAGNQEGFKRADEVLKYTSQELYMAALSFGRLGVIFDEKSVGEKGGRGKI
jgi:hypothetical protein